MYIIIFIVYTKCVMLLHLGLSYYILLKPEVGTNIFCVITNLYVNYHPPRSSVNDQHWLTTCVYEIKSKIELNVINRKEVTNKIIKFNIILYLWKSDNENSSRESDLK